MEECNSYIFIDVQGYCLSFGYIPKEIAIFDGIRLANFLFKPPFKRNLLSTQDDKIVAWSEEYHGLDWDSGYTDLNEVNGIIENIFFHFNKPKVYVKGVEKTKFLKKILGDESIIGIPIFFYFVMVFVTYI